MAFQVVSLLAALLVTSVRAQYPMLGGLFGGNPLLNPFQTQPNNHNQQQQVDPNMMTCIGSDSRDTQSQIRLTIKPLNRQMGLGHPGMGLGFGPMGPGVPNHDQEQDWTIEGIMLPSQLVQKAGTYKVAMFTGGRTHGECKMSALGKVMNTNHRNPLFNAMRMGPFSPFGLGMNPMFGMTGGGLNFQSEANGEVSNNALVSTGTTIFSGMVRRMSFNDMVGGSIAVCQSLHGNQCYGKIAYCCTMCRDHLPASEVYVEPAVNPQQGNPLAFAQAGGGLVGGNVAGVPGVPGVPGPLPPAAGATAVAVDGGLF